MGTTSASQSVVLGRYKQLTALGRGKSGFNESGIKPITKIAKLIVVVIDLSTVALIVLMLTELGIVGIKIEFLTVQHLGAYHQISLGSAFQNVPLNGRVLKPINGVDHISVFGLTTVDWTTVYNRSVSAVACKINSPVLFALVNLVDKVHKVHKPRYLFLLDSSQNVAITFPTFVKATKSPDNRLISHQILRIASKFNLFIYCHTFLLFAKP